MELMSIIGIIVTIFMVVIGIDYLIRRFFEALYEHNNKSNRDAVRTIKEMFNEFPKLMLETVQGIKKIEEEEDEKRNERFQERMKKDIEDWSKKD